eukprot:5720834-Prymnesium_polylepis.2
MGVPARALTRGVARAGPYFGDCLSLDDLDELNIEIIRNTLYKVRPAPALARACDTGGRAGGPAGRRARHSERACLSERSEHVLEARACSVGHSGGGALPF